MLWLLMSMACVAVVGVAGYMLGHHTCGRQLADLMYSDREVGTQVMEKLAKHWGARLEMFEQPSKEPPR